MERIYITVRLWVKSDRFTEFTNFENKALAIMTSHGGKLLGLRKNHAACDGQPHETHLMEFPSPLAFEAYKTDPDLLAMTQIREACIAKTEVMIFDQPHD